MVPREITRTGAGIEKDMGSFNDFGDVELDEVTPLFLYV
jgi:hypothetical protein